MKNLLFLSLLLVNLVSYSQIVDDFSDGNFTENPKWIGTTDDFIINSDGELQTNAEAKGSSFLSTRSQILNNATWEFTVKINNKTSKDNYATVYLASDVANLKNPLTGYLVIIGGTDDKISLCKQNGNTQKTLIKGTKKCIDFKNIEVDIKVIRTKEGEFELFRKIKGKDSEFVSEGKKTDTSITSCNFFGVLATYSKSYRKNYSFDNIKITGEKVEDTTPPQWIYTIVNKKNTNQLKLQFSEEVTVRKETSFEVDNQIGTPITIDSLEYNNVLILTFAQPFERDKVYTLTIKNLSDYYGNVLSLETQKTGIPQKVEKDNLVINEILFDAKKGMPEFFEIYNTSDKILGLDSIAWGVNSIKKDEEEEKEEYKFSNSFPSYAIILPKSYLAVTKDAKTLRKEYNPPKKANIITVKSFSSLNNSEATLYIVNTTDTTLCDKVTFSEKWHHPIIRNTKGVSLEKINPLFDANNGSSWHSASFDVNYGTPGYKNSQYVENPKENNNKKTKVWVEPEAFSPDNDGIEDVCFIKYKAEEIGNTANIIIFTSAGVKVRQIASNHLLSNDGYIIWDGKTDKNKNVNSGIYVLYFEIINTTTGNRKVVKKPIVISAR